MEPIGVLMYKYIKIVLLLKNEAKETMHNHRNGE
jgi:hypothetical protein